MTKSAMHQHARNWKPLAQRADEKRAAGLKGKDTPDSKGPGPDAWKGSVTGKKVPRNG